MKPWMCVRCFEEKWKASIGDLRAAGMYDASDEAQDPDAKCSECGYPPSEAVRLRLIVAQLARAQVQATERPALRDDRAWTVEEVAYFLGDVSESFVRKLEAEGKLPALPRIGTCVRFDPQVVREFRAHGTVAVQAVKAKVARKSG